ncbi:hypothetical protein EYF80_017395 [Liparis tanakae]|uniref:Uncharacterized protein n=1 Tax=Liparis tanakae TaxID=230148 RepID=A0A4Z2I2R1_9TELE|nr:hypothetical protein EYF80_017395 [Liparis tanakae]
MKPQQQLPDSQPRDGYSRAGEKGEDRGRQRDRQTEKKQKEEYIKRGWRKKETKRVTEINRKKWTMVGVNGSEPDRQYAGIPSNLWMLPQHSSLSPIITCAEEVMFWVDGSPTTLSCRAELSMVLKQIGYRETGWRKSKAMRGGFGKKKGWEGGRDEEEGNRAFPAGCEVTGSPTLTAELSGPVQAKVSLSSLRTDNVDRKGFLKASFSLTSPPTHEYMLSNTEKDRTLEWTR